MIDMQCIVWNTWGPIESGAQFAFDWSESTVAMFANWGTILFLLSVIPLSKMIEVKYKKCSGDAGSTTDIRMLWSAMVCFDLLQPVLVDGLATASFAATDAFIHFHPLSSTFIHFRQL